MEVTINRRIKLLIEALGMNKNSFAKMIGVSAQTMQNIVGERQSKPSFEVLEKISMSVKGLSSDWLLTGNGEMFKSHHQEMNSFKSKDKGAFGSEVERVLQENQELRKQVRDCLEIIKNLSLGKDEVAEYSALESFKKAECRPESPIQLPIQQKLEKIAV